MALNRPTAARTHGPPPVRLVLPRPALLGLLAAVVPTAAASAADLKVDSITVVQSVQLGSTTLVGGRGTMVRAKIGVFGATAPVPGVDARLRVLVDGTEMSISPLFSCNGPLTAPLSPNLANLNDTINFLVVVPESADVDFVVDVDPAGAVAESNEANNTLLLPNQVFACRDVVEIDYVSVNYTPGGGEPPAELIEPGVGDGFVRAVYAPGVLNYHRSPLGPLTWTQNINSSDNALLNTLKDQLVAQIPAAGYPKPDFIYGWLPGNPYSGNGKSIGIPGDAAFGNSEPVRFQRTFAHELGHLVGLSHNSSTIGTVGVDVEHHLWDTEALAQTFPTTKKDVMVAGQLTNAAFINQGSFNTFLNDSKVQCTADAPPEGGGRGGDDAAGPLLRISGEIFHEEGAASLDPVVRIDQHRATLDDPTGDLRITARDDAGAVLWEIRTDTQRTREACCAQELRQPAAAASPFHVLGPAVVAGVPVAAVEVRLAAEGHVLAARSRSASPPSVQVVALEEIAPAAQRDQGGGPQPDAFHAGTLRVSWVAEDPDGDELSHFVFYSPDNGVRWLPLAVRRTGDSFDFDATSIPSTQGLKSRFFVRTTDGFDSADSPVFEAAAMGAGTPPDVHLLSPNAGTIHVQHTTVILHASAWDMEDLMLPDEAILWESSIDGPIGSGRTEVTRLLTPGVHEISVTGTDISGMSTTRTTIITIMPRAVLGADIDLDGTVDGTDLGLLLVNWGAAYPDLNGDRIVDGGDLGVLLGAWSAGG